MWWFQQRKLKKFKSIIFWNFNFRNTNNERVENEELPFESFELFGGDFEEAKVSTNPSDTVVHINSPSVVHLFKTVDDEKLDPTTKVTTTTTLVPSTTTTTTTTTITSTTTTTTSTSAIAISSTTSTTTSSTTTIGTTIPPKTSLETTTYTRYSRWTRPSKKPSTPKRKPSRYQHITNSDNDIVDNDRTVRCGRIRLQNKFYWLQTRPEIKGGV